MRLLEVFKFGRRKNDAALARLNEHIKTLTKEGFLKGVKEVAPEDWNRGVAKTYVDIEKIYLHKRSRIRVNSIKNLERALDPIKREFAKSIQRIIKFIGP